MQYIGFREEYRERKRVNEGYKCKYNRKSNFSTHGGKSMISNPKHGWNNFDLKAFHGPPSYSTDVPVDLLNAFIQYHLTGTGVAWFDEEGAEFTLIITPYSLFIIEEKDKPVLNNFYEMNIRNLEKELIEDIGKDLTGWSEFITDDDREEVIIHRDEIRNKIAILKKLGR